MLKVTWSNEGGELDSWTAKDEKSAAISLINKLAGVPCLRPGDSITVTEV